ncbi:unnamed protein product [Ilex paraguariensis]|uniref:Uncharacterized protein n=1 Tax=Ilex paraguariensis TaxID=185542 RepID=A0ABC8UMW8_9AQUA
MPQERTRASMENDTPQERTRESIRDSDSSNYSELYNSEYDLDEDDKLYEINVDKDVEWAGVGDKGKGVKDGTSAFHGTNEDDVHSDYADSDELCSFDDSSSEDDGVKKKESQQGAGTMSSGVTTAGANTDGMIGLGAGATNVSSRRGQLAMRRNKMNAPTTTQVSHSTGGVQ